ncbi:DUF2591 domain-containing protein (plasmid) [Cupriavidus pinatubonensis]|uniref:phage protein NinX family protein n=1 Tax=Cupriavidus pinatubonensis TaxID=248026 RepID=UPI001C72A26D|nr:phage protein NinX family protein [Cupriavidus pinatubonensis]QYY33674.1 DUF2591 domain-containing protein [Cupriavidus pinatubonensis]
MGPVQIDIVTLLINDADEWSGAMAYIKTQDLNGAALDWAVATCEIPNLDSGSARHLEHFLTLRSEDVHYDQDLKQHRTGRFRYSERWDQGGPIIEREGISVQKWSDGSWRSYLKMSVELSGPTSLVAAMRCYVATTLGNEVAVPDDLLKG